jgi:hypothetical protein
VAIIALLGGYQSSQILGNSSAEANYATTTSTGRFPTTAVLRSGPGVFTGVTITGAAAGVMEFYNATTSDPSQRAASLSSSTILIASFPASAAANHYPFNQSFSTGLVVSIVGTMPTSTILWK